MDYLRIENEARGAMEILLAAAPPRPGALMVIGCSTSEVAGARIGSASNEDVARAVMDGILPLVEKNGLYLAVQGCEHINRALCVPRACLERFHLQEVWVKPHLHAGGAFATEATRRIADYAMAEDLRGQASLGMDIGGTLIGMHLHPVVVPVHTELRRIGEATLVLAKTRPKYVGGPRALYPEGAAAH